MFIISDKVIPTYVILKKSQKKVNNNLQLFHGHAEKYKSGTKAKLTSKVCESPSIRKQSSIFPPSAINRRQGSSKIILLDQLTGIDN